MSATKIILFETQTDIFYEDGTSISKIAEPVVITRKKVVSRSKPLVDISSFAQANKYRVPDALLSDTCIYEF